MRGFPAKLDFFFFQYENPCLFVCSLDGSHRFLSDPRNVGTEQIAATDVPREFLEAPYTECKALEPYGH